MFRRRVAVAGRFSDGLVDPEWIAYPDAPRGVADRVSYKLVLASCREDWEKTRDPLALHTAQTWVLMHRQWEPNWLRDAIGVVLLQRRGKEHLQRYTADVQHRARWAWVRRYREAGLTWPEAREKAAERLAPTSASGSADTMKRSYEVFQRRLKTRSAEKAITDWLVAKHPPERADNYLDDPPKVTWEP
jgi:hypothetical protein